MKHRFRLSPKLAACASLLLTLTACGGMKVWPFESGSSSSNPGAPANAAEYRCEGGKRFYVRFLDNGNTAWVIYSDREVGLAKAAAGSRYSNGIAILDINGSDAVLTDGPRIAYNGCKAAGKLMGWSPLPETASKCQSGDARFPLTERSDRNEDYNSRD